MVIAQGHMHVNMLGTGVHVQLASELMICGAFQSCTGQTYGRSIFSFSCSCCITPKRTATEQPRSELAGTSEDSTSCFGTVPRPC